MDVRNYGLPSSLIAGRLSVTVVQSGEDNCSVSKSTLGVRRQEMGQEKREFVLENDEVRVVFHGEHGGIESLMNKAVQKEIIKCKQYAQLFKIIYPVNGVRSHHFDSKEQEVSDFRLVEDGSQKVLTIVYDRMKSEAGSFEVKVEVEARLALKGDEISLQMRIENSDQGELTQVYFPLISGLREIGDDPEEDTIIIPQAGGNIIRNPLNAFPGSKEPLGFNEWKTVNWASYPGHASMQWMDYSSDSHGLYLSCLNQEGEFLVLWAKKNLWDEKEHLSLSLIKYPYLKANDSWISSEFVVSPHRGDWHTAADKYRDWLEGWMEKAKTPEWLKDSNGFYHFVLRHGDGTMVNEVEEIPEIYREAQGHGVDLLFVCGWYEGGHDWMYPEYVAFDPEGLGKAFEEVHRAGGKLLLYTNGAIYTTGNPDWETQGKRWAVRRWDGSIAFLGGNAPGEVRWEWSPGHYPSFEGSTFALMCPREKEWISKLMEGVENAAKLKADVVLVDVVACISALCFEEKHGHENPSLSWGPGIIGMLKSALEIGKRYNPDLSLCVEGIVDVYTPYVGIYHSRVDGYQPPAESYPEVIRYTMPWVKGITGGFIDMGDTRKLSHYFILGLPMDLEIHTHERGRLSMDSELSEKIKKLNHLRRENSDLLVDGIFKDTVGVSCSHQDIRAKAFVEEESLLLALWQAGESAISTAKIVVDPIRLGAKLANPEGKLLPARKPVELHFDDQGRMAIELPEFHPDEVWLLRIDSR